VHEATAVRRLQSGDRGRDQRAGGELHDDARQPTPGRVELAGHQQRHHGWQRGRDRQPDQVAGPGRAGHPKDHQHQHPEQQIRQPLGADRPRRAVPARIVEERLEPQLRHQHLTHIADRCEPVNLLRRDVTDVQREDDPQRGQVQRDQIDGPHPGQPQPEEVQGGAGRPGSAHPVEVIPGQYEAAEDEEQIDALGAAVEHRRERVEESGCRVAQQRAEVKEHDPHRGDDAESREGLDLSAAHNILSVRPLVFTRHCSRICAAGPPIRAVSLHATRRNHGVGRVSVPSL